MFITPNWVRANFGVVPVEDVNPILISQKEFIAQFNSLVNDRVNARKSWLEKNMVVILLCLGIISLSIAFAIESYAVQQFLGGVISTAAAHLNSILTVLNQSKTLVAQEHEGNTMSEEQQLVKERPKRSSYSDFIGEAEQIPRIKEGYELKLFDGGNFFRDDARMDIISQARIMKSELDYILTYEEGEMLNGITQEMEKAR